MTDKAIVWPAILAGVLLWTAGCASPPSVVPLLQVVDQALVGEQDAIQTEVRRQAARSEQDRLSLDDAFEADLADQAELDHQWVADHARVYAVARESLLREQFAQQQTLATRQENLALAREAQARAVRLIQRQDQLFRDVPDLRRWVQDMLNKETDDE